MGHVTAIDLLQSEQNACPQFKTTNVLMLSKQIGHSLDIAVSSDVLNIFIKGCTSFFNLSLIVFRGFIAANCSRVIRWCQTSP